MISLAWRLARRDLRGGTAGLAVVLFCLCFGVAAIAGIFSLRATLDQGIAENGRAILGGDLELSTGLGPFPAAVPVWFTARGARVSQTIETRSILVAPSGRRLLAAVRAVNPAWPLVGQVTTTPPDQFAALAPAKNAPPGLLLDPDAAASLNLHPGDPVTLGGVSLVFRGVITASPDSLGTSQIFGVKTFVATAALAGTPLIQPGGLVNFSLQILLPPNMKVTQTEAAFRQAFPNNPWRLRDDGAATPDLTRLVGQLASFMALLALAALVVGGIGVANGVASWLMARAKTIATMRCLGAPARLVSLIHAMQLLLLGVPGILAGLTAGALAPRLILPLLRGKLPLPAHLRADPAALALAGCFGVIVGFLFAFTPLRRASAIPGAALFRQADMPQNLPWSWPAFAVQALAAAALLALALIAVPQPDLALGFAAATAFALLLLRALAALLLRLLPRLPAPRDAAAAMGLRRLYGPASSLKLIMVSAGIGLTVLAAVAQIRGNLLAEFSGALPPGAPSFYFIDIQPADLPKFQAALQSTGAAHDIQTMPSLRARILAIAGTPVENFHPPESSAWPLRTDIAFTYAATPPPGTRLTQGSWWPPNYLGPPLVSFDSQMAHDWGLKPGDTLTVDVLGRVFDLRIANLRAIKWQTLKMNFLLVGTPDPFVGAPATLIATVKTDPGREGDVLAAVTNALPSVTGIDVTQVLLAFAALLSEISTAVSLAGLIALAAGALVLISAVAAEREARIAEAVILKTLGASRAHIRRAWLVEFAVAGGCAGLAAALLGTAAAALSVTQIFQTDWHFQPVIMLATILGSIALMMLFGFAATARALRQPAALWLRREG